MTNKIYELEEYEGTQEIEGYDITTYYEQGSENPWEAWDCDIPLLAHTYHGYTAYGEDIRDFIQSKVEVTKKNWHDVAVYIYDKITDNYASMGMSHDRTLRELLRSYYQEFGSIIDALQYLLDDMTLDFEALKELCDLFDIDYYTNTARGSCQSHWADLFIVLTDDWYKTCGNDRDAPKEEKQQWMQGSFELWENWAFGNVYWVEIERDDEQIGSCGGFYGSDHSKSGLAEYVADIIGSNIEERRKARLKHTKTMIRNHVPLEVR